MTTAWRRTTRPSGPTGEREALWKVESQKHVLPLGTSVTGCVLPKLAVGLTRTGSLVGLFGWTVES